jgi:hypothetical protein
MQRVGLDQHPREIDTVQELPQGADLTAGIGGVGALGDGHAQRVGVETHLSNKTHCAGSVFSDRASQCLAVAHQSVDRVCDTGLAYIDSTIASGSAITAILLIAQDTTPGREFFCWAFKTTGGNEALHRDSCHALYKSPGTTGWNSFAIFPKTERQIYSQIVLHGYSGDRFSGLPSAINSSIVACGQQLRSGIALSHDDFVLEPQGLFDTPPPLIQLPAPLYIGATSLHGASTHFGKVTQPDGLMLQLGQRSSSYDVWLWVPTGTSHNQPSPRHSALSLSQWKECNELHFINGQPTTNLQLVTGTADFIRNFPHMNVVGARQHAQQGPLMSSAGKGVTAAGKALREAGAVIITAPVQA